MAWRWNRPEPHHPKMKKPGVVTGGMGMGRLGGAFGNTWSAFFIFVIAMTVSDP
jgi:hypothetical protein